jgi:hypothetical protein
MNSGPQTPSVGAALLQRPWYPYVVAVYPLWFLYLQNLGQVAGSSVIAATLVSLLFTAALLWIARRLFRSPIVAALVVTVLTGAFYAYGPLHDAVLRIAVNPFLSPGLRAVAEKFVPHVVLSVVLLLLCGLFVWLINRRAARDSNRLTNACNVAAAALFGILLGRLAGGLWHQHQLMPDAMGEDSGAGRTTSVLGYNPDIYYIILDGYARADVLREYYGFDNGPFLGELEKRGFAVNDASNANYYWTFLSLASSLNYDYLQNFAPGILSDAAASRGRGGFGQISQTLQDNRAAHFLRARGYRFVHLKSSSPETVRNPYADEQVGCDGRLFDDEYFRAIAEVSWLKALGSMATTDLAECHQYRLQALGDQAKRKGPKFVFAHFLPPHHPYLFDRDGNVIRHVTLSNQFDFQARLWENKAAYLDQLRYANRTLLEVLDRIIAESEHPPIIIVQSDHGPNLRDGLTLEQAMALRFANFAAYLLPGAAPQALPRNTAPVNQFRHLFNYYFEAGLPILADRNFVSEFRTPLQLHEVATGPLVREHP